MFLQPGSISETYGEFGTYFNKRSPAVLFEHSLRCLEEYITWWRSWIREPGISPRGNAGNVADEVLWTPDVHIKLEVKITSKV